MLSFHFEREKYVSSWATPKESWATPKPSFGASLGDPAFLDLVRGIPGRPRAGGCEVLQSAQVDICHGKDFAHLYRERSNLSSVRSRASAPSHALQSSLRFPREWCIRELLAQRTWMKTVRPHRRSVRYIAT